MDANAGKEHALPGSLLESVGGLGEGGRPIRTMTTIEDIYKSKVTEPSDINEHLPTLRRYAERCSHVTEFGVRWIVSTWALLAARPNVLVSYDALSPERFGKHIEDVYSVAKDIGVAFTFILADVRLVEIAETDMLFTDTDHTYEQLRTELWRHSPRVRKYIAIHDTFPESAMTRAITEFLSEFPQWTLLERLTNNNGLTILANSTQ